MTGLLLRNMLEDIRFDALPPEWNSFNLQSFSKSKRLWDYQQRAAENGIKVLWKYFEDFLDYQPNESQEANWKRKQNLFQWYQGNGLTQDLSLRLDRQRRDTRNLLISYYPQQNGRIPYELFINRMCFWMATGSGKSLIIIKLIQVLKGLIEREEIPPWNILILTHRDDLIQQLRNHVDEFNYAGNGVHIRLKELKEYPEVKKNPLLPFKEELTVFYYKSDNLSDEQKEKVIDFRNYDNDGKWYIFLDEAHRGDKEESKRQHIYSILSRNGFLFNSSATFSEEKDRITCAYEFNLSSFINAGYGKHIAILKQETKAFRDGKDYSNEEKQKITLKSLILLAYVKKLYQRIAKVQKGIYHNPLLLTLVNSVNIDEADLKLFFRELERIGKGDVEQEVFDSALNELWEELKQEPELMFEGDNKVKLKEEDFKGISKEDILDYVYNAKSGGDIEVSFRPSDKKQVAFKLVTSDKHFALMKTGEMPDWLRNELNRFNVNHQFEEEGFFERINRDDSPINILMGSRSFYEGWDSNRPNVINYINIGLGENAKKFILQSIGRGVRIEPVKNERKRLLSLHNAQEITVDLFNGIKAIAPPQALPIETLFVFGTNRNALQTVIQELQSESKRGSGTQLSLFEVNPRTQGHKLLVPIYKKAEHPIYREKNRGDFDISDENFTVLKEFIQFMLDNRVLLMNYSESLKEMPVEKLKALRESIRRKENFYKLGGKNYKSLEIMMQRIFNYFGLIPEEFKDLKELGEEIKHFKNVKVSLEDITEIQRKIKKVKEYPIKKGRLEGELSQLSEEGKQEIQKLLDKESTETYEYSHRKIEIKHIANHYYNPLILSEDEKVDYIQHIIKTQSEAEFINDLVNYLDKSDNKFREFDWWMFSKLDESLDEVYIPYYNPNINRISYFYPDFIFWLKKGRNYFIVFVDPKGTEHVASYRKIDGYKELFEENGKEKVFVHDGFQVKIALRLKAADVSKTLPEYKKYWFGDIGRIVKSVKV